MRKLSLEKVKMTFSYSTRELWPTSTTPSFFPFSAFFFARASRFSSSPSSFFLSFALVLSHDISLSWQISASFYFPSFPWSLSRSALLFISTLNYLLLLICLLPACPPSALSLSLSRSFKYLTSFSLKYLFEFKLAALLISLICTMQIFNWNSCSSNSNNRKKIFQLSFSRF